MIFQIRNKSHNHMEPKTYHTELFRWVSFVVLQGWHLEKPCRFKDSNKINTWKWRCHSLVNVYESQRPVKQGHRIESVSAGNCFCYPFELSHCLSTVKVVSLSFITYEIKWLWKETVFQKKIPPSATKHSLCRFSNTKNPNALWAHPRLTTLMTNLS